MSRLLAFLVIGVALMCIQQASALTSAEIAMFGARTYTDMNTGLQGYMRILDDEEDDDIHVLEANGIPDHAAGPYPNSEDSSEIIEQSFVYYIPKSPTHASETTELPMGTIALSLNGVPMFNPYTAVGTDAVENEIFDDCDGHPTPETGTYHYHSIPICVFDFVDGVESNIVGVALDGYPIYGPNDENGNELMSADLDECHGRWLDGHYRYHLTQDFPYILGCYSGTVDSRNMMNGPPSGGQGPGQGPDDESDDAVRIAHCPLLLLLTVFSTIALQMKIYII